MALMHRCPEGPLVLMISKPRAHILEEPLICVVSVQTAPGGSERETQPAPGEQGRLLLQPGE